MKIEIYSESFGIEKVEEVREYSEDWEIEEIIRDILMERWNGIEEIKRGMGEVLGGEYSSLNDVVEEVIVEKESIDDGMGYRIDEERYLRIVEEEE